MRGKHETEPPRQQNQTKNPMSAFEKGTEQGTDNIMW